MSRKKSAKSEVIEWLLFIGVITFLYLTGLHTPVLGALQGLILKTGIIQPSTSESTNEIASYDFKLTDADGNAVDFKQFKNKTVFLNYWATWCPPCIAEMSDIDDLFAEFSDNDDIAFVLISFDKSFSTAKEYVNRKEYAVPIYRLASDLPSILESQSLPTTFVISPHGEILVKKQGMAKYNTKKFRNFLEDLSNN